MQDQSKDMPTGEKPLGAKIRSFMKIPDIGQITAMMDDRFGQLLGKLDEIKAVLERIETKT